MLKKILQDMYIDPDLLSELDEEQKQLLFCKMREEQIRRWKERESSSGAEKQTKSPFKASKPCRLKGKGRVDFLHGVDGNPWTWVMGEHPSDKSVDEILEAEALHKANTLAKKEASEIQSFQGTKKNGPSAPDSKLMFGPTRFDSSAELAKPSSCQELLRSKHAGIGNGKEDLLKLEQRLSKEIYMSLKLERDRAKEKATEENKAIEKVWLEQEKISKRVEEERRSLAKSAREIWSNSLGRRPTQSRSVAAGAGDETVSSATLPLPLRASRGGNYKNLGKDRPEMPSSREAIIKWFQEVEEPRAAGLDPKTGVIANWFHGIIDRDTTEALLRDKPSGSFLIRVSDKIWGYAISFRSESRCKHFLIDAGENGYQFFGLFHVAHASLADLVAYHEVNPLCVNSRDFLKQPVGQSKDIPDYEGLFKATFPLSEDSYL